LLQQNGHSAIQVPFTPGRMDATQDNTDVQSFGVLEPLVDGFRNFIHPSLPQTINEHEWLIEKAFFLNLSISEMSVLMGGLRVLGIGSNRGGGGSSSAFTNRVGQLTNDFYVNLLNNDLVWTSSNNNSNMYEGRDRTTNQLLYTGTSIDLLFGSNSILRAHAEVWACQDSESNFCHAFTQAFAKVMDLDRFDVTAATTTTTPTMSRL